MAPSCVDTLDGGRQSPAALIFLSKKIFLVIHFHRVKVILRVRPAAQRLPVSELLDIAKPSGDSLTNSKQAPQVVDKNVQPILDQSEVYSGCYGRISVNFYGFSTNGNKGIAAESQKQSCPHKRIPRI